MLAESKYYYSREKEHLYSSRRNHPEIIKWNKDYFVSMNEDLDYVQYIELSVSKFYGESYSKPKSSEYTTVKPIIEELFNEYYYQGLGYLNETDHDEGEFYLIRNSKDWFQVEYYSQDDKNSRQLTIDFRDSIDDLYLTLRSYGGRSGRQLARKNGNPITIDTFEQYLNLTLKYLSDPNSYPVYLDSYIKDFKSLVNGDEIIIGFDVSAERKFTNILDRLKTRKKVIEQDLIEKDDLKPIHRTKLRGELLGIDYAIKVIKMNR
ncbi:MAG: hypothetical protein HQ521_01915 [Bacteroidetes bacterium]|nr:hypothetical protein [Bacteroidota bacterium]